MQVSTANDIDLNEYLFKLKFTEGKPQTRFSNTKTGSILTVKTPWVIFPFEPSSYSRSKGSTDTPTDWNIVFKASCYETLDVSKVLDKNGSPSNFEFDKNKDDIILLFAILEAIESKAVEFLTENSQKLFKKNLKKEIIEEAYLQKIVKKSDKKDASGLAYPDSVTVKIMKNKDGNPDVVVEDFEGNPITISSWEDIDTKLIPLMGKGSAGRCIFQLRTSVVNNKFFLTLKLCALQVNDRRRSAGTSIFTFRELPVKADAKKITSDENTHDSENEGSEVEVDEDA